MPSINPKERSNFVPFVFYKNNNSDFFYDTSIESSNFPTDSSDACQILLDVQLGDFLKVSRALSRLEEIIDRLSKEKYLLSLYNFAHEHSYSNINIVENHRNTNDSIENKKVEGKNNDAKAMISRNHNYEHSNTTKIVENTDFSVLNKDFEIFCEQVVFLFLFSSKVVPGLHKKGNLLSHAQINLIYNKYKKTFLPLMAEFTALKNKSIPTGSLQKISSSLPSQVTTRFPPEPSGYLHLGHAKAVLINNNLARKHNGTLIVRFDDTNPAVESLEFENSIKADLKDIMNITPDIFTHTSDYFIELLGFCRKLIAEGLAYCDDTPGDIMASERYSQKPSACRNTPSHENLKIFDGMMLAKYPDHCVRAKIDYKSVNTAMRDPVIYRHCPVEHERYKKMMQKGKYNLNKFLNGFDYSIKELYESFETDATVREKSTSDSNNCNSNQPQIFKTGSTAILEKNLVFFMKNVSFAFLPTYDFCCPIVDSLEKVTHAFRTNEYRARDAVYSWILQKLELGHKPIVKDFSKLCFENTVLSKRKLKEVVETKNIQWDDPRMPTLRGIVRRGLMPDVLKNYISGQGMSQKNCVVSWDKIWAENKSFIDKTSNRITAIPVKNSLEVCIENYNDLIDFLIKNNIHSAKFQNDDSKSTVSSSLKNNDTNGTTNNIRFGSRKNEKQNPQDETNEITTVTSKYPENTCGNRIMSNIPSNLDEKFKKLGFNREKGDNISSLNLIISRNRREKNASTKTVSFSNNLYLPIEKYQADEEITLMGIGNFKINFIDSKATLYFVKDGDIKSTRFKVQWVDVKKHVKHTFIEYSDLFKPDGVFNEHSREETDYICEMDIQNANHGQIIQIERDGFYIKDGNCFNLVPYTKQARKK